MTLIPTSRWCRIFSLPKVIRKALQDAGHEDAGRGVGRADLRVVRRFRGQRAPHG